MPVTVYLPDEEIDFPEATKYFPDEQGKLHVINAVGKHIAVFAHGGWQHATVEQ